MPEEVNRVLTDHVSDLRFCPTESAVRNLEREGITRGVYLHRAENTDDVNRLGSIFQTLDKIAGDGLPVIVPLHLRTRERLESLKLPLNSVHLIEPISYLDMLILEKRAKVILTDSGGVQKEAFFFGCHA